MAYTYDDFLNAANSSGMLAKISESDLSLAKQYPEFGLSILSLTKDLDSATTAEQKLLATEAAEQLRSAYTSYGSGGMGTYDAQINNLLQQAADYGSFNYGKETEYQRLLNSVTNPEQFKYDLDSDIVWDSYRKQYLREGERATADTLAKVSAATGGRPSSYAVTAAHQAGDYYNSQLTDMIPTLYQNAYQRYLNDLGLKQTGLEALAADRETAYGEHMDSYNVLLSKLEQLLALKEAEQEQENTDDNFIELVGKDALTGENVDLSTIYYDDTDTEQAMTFAPMSKDQLLSNGGDASQTDAVKKFKSTHMTLEQALSRGITRKEYTAMVKSWLNQADLSDAEFEALEAYYGIG